MRWYQTPEWQHYLEQTWHYYAQRRDFSLEISQATEAAAVDLYRRVVYLNPHFPQVSPKVRGAGLLDERDTLVHFLKGFLAHEAGHVRFSRSKPHGLLGQLWNILEDTRIENQMMRCHPELLYPFEFLRSVFYHQIKEMRGDSFSGCLIHRFEQGETRKRWKPDHPLEWEQVRPWVERAWEADSSEAVLGCAMKILEILNLEPDAPAQELPFEVTADGGSQENDTDEPATDEPATDSSAALEDGEAEREDAQDSDTNGQDSSASEDENSPADPLEEREAEPDSAANPTNEQNSSAASQDGEADGNQDSDENSPADSLEGEAEPEEIAQGEEPAARGYILTATEKEHSEEQPQLEVHLQTGVGSEPLPPQFLETAYAQLEYQVTPMARNLAKLIKPPEQSKHTLPHRSRGDFNFARYLQGSNRIYDQREIPSKPQTVDLHILIDCSGSMVPWIPLARELAMTFHLAGEFAHCPVHLWAFNKEFFAINTKADIQKLTAAGGTQLAPALEAALQSPTLPNQKKLIVVLCDGMLEHQDAGLCQKLARTQRIMPILIGDAVEGEKVFSQIFGQACVAKDLVATVQRWVKGNNR